MQIKFQEAFELQMAKVGGHKKVIQCEEFEGIPLRISCEKNSFGTTHRRIDVRVLWWYEKGPDGKFRQVTVWDWDHATIHLLNTLLHGDHRSPLGRAPATHWCSL